MLEETKNYRLEDLEENFKLVLKLTTITTPKVESAEKLLNGICKTSRSLKRYGAIA